MQITKSKPTGAANAAAVRFVYDSAVPDEVNRFSSTLAPWAY